MALSDVERTVEKETHRVSEAERRLLEKLKRGEHVSKNVNLLQEEQLTLGQKLADRLADVAGSWGFILSFLGLILAWIVINGILLLQRSWDPYPFILLNLILSLLAGLQAPVIMMSQNRQETKDRIRAEHDYEVNLKAEMEIEQLHAKLDALRETQWSELVELQQRQISMLEQQIQMLQKLASNE